VRTRTDLPGRVALLLLAAAAGWCAPACRPRTNVYAPPPPPEVTVAHPVRRPTKRYLEYTGTTEPFESVELRARVSGFLEQVSFKPGTEVKKGDLLFVIDRRTYQAALDRAQAQVLADEAAHKAAESDARIAEELAQKRAGSELDKLIKIGRRDAAGAALEASRAALASARLDLEFCEVRAPHDGRITKNLVDTGNLVGAGGQPTLLATLVRTRPLYVSVDASESDVLMVRRARMARMPGAEPGQIAPGVWRPVELATADTDEFTIHGRVDYVDPALNPQTGTIRVRCRFENEDDVLLPGLFVRLRVFLDEEEATLAPDIALLTDQSGRYALVVNDQGVVEVRHVKTGGLDGSLRVVLEGLSATDRMVVNGLQRARPGAAVRAVLREPGPPATAPTDR
jgi:RND family efflux transporter MFP subunit